MFGIQFGGWSKVNGATILVHAVYKAYWWQFPAGLTPDLSSVIPVGGWQVQGAIEINSVDHSG
jgi:hypothetical protein